MSPIRSLAQQMSYPVLVRELNRANANLDEWAGAGIDPSTNPELRREYLIARELRAVYRERSGEQM